LEEGLAVAGEAALGAAQGRHPGVQLTEQLLQLGHDAALFGEGGKRDLNGLELILGDMGKAGPPVCSPDQLIELIVDRLPEKLSVQQLFGVKDSENVLVQGGPWT
jgi:hypothetical protein